VIRHEKGKFYATLSLKRLDEAERYLSEAVMIRPSDSLNQELLGDLYAAFEERTEEEIEENFLRFTPDGKGFITSGNTSFSIRDLKTGREGSR
jgi:hypothetical protein